MKEKTQKHLKYIEKVSAILFELDPVKIHSPEEDEYDYEARNICRYLKVEEVQKDLDKIHHIVYHVFCNLFNYGNNPDGDGDVVFCNVTGPKENYLEAAQRIYAMFEEETFLNLKKDITSWMKGNYNDFIGSDGFDEASLALAAAIEFNICKADDDCPEWLLDFASEVADEIKDGLIADQEIKDDEDKMRRCASHW